MKDQVQGKFRRFIWLLAVIDIRVDLVFMDLDSINNMHAMMTNSKMKESDSSRFSISAHQSSWEKQINLEFY